MNDPFHLHVSPKHTTGVLRGIPEDDFGGELSARGLSGLAHKIYRNFQDYGLGITLQKTLAYLLRSIYFQQVYRIYSIRLDAFRSPVELDNHKFIFKILTPQNVEMIAQVENIAEWMRGQLTEAISSGQLCLVALDGDRVAGFNLINFNQATLVLVNLQKKLRKGFAWSEHIAVKKEFRKSGLGSQLRFRIFQELKKRGIRRLYGGTLQSNVASLSLSKSVGFKQISDIHYRKILSFEKWRYERVRA